MELLQTLMPGMSEKQRAYLFAVISRCPTSWFEHMEGRIFGSSLKRSCTVGGWTPGVRRPAPPAECRASRRLAQSRFELLEEVGFYLSFLHFLDRVNTELAGPRGPPMCPWKELLDLIDKKPVFELDLTDPAEIGFACGALIKRFSRAYYKAMKFQGQRRISYVTGC